MTIREINKALIGREEPFIERSLDEITQSKNVKSAITAYEKVFKIVKARMPDASDNEIASAISRASEFDLKNEKDAVSRTIKVIRNRRRWAWKKWKGD